MRTESILPEMKQLLQQYFLLLNGKKAMTGDLRLGGNTLRLLLILRLDL